MKCIAKGAEPHELADFRRRTPQATWKAYQNNKARREALHQQLKKDQGGLCCYCEIDLREKSPNSEADLRVEHFHPKSDGTTWHLDWQNLLACCHGGSQRNVPDRYTTDHSCDIPKGGKSLDDVILKPTTLPTAPLFHFNWGTGSIQVNETDCSIHGVDVQKARQTIYELQLDGIRLRRLRLGVLNEITDTIDAMMKAGLDFESSCLEIAGRMLQKDQRGHWPPFFSACRSLLGPAAEAHLIEMGYQG